MMFTDMQFKFLSEEQMQWIQFRAQNIFQELKDEEQWNHFCKRKTQDSVEKAVMKSDAAIQVEPVNTMPKTILHSKTFPQKEQRSPIIVQQAKRNVRMNPSAENLHIILEKLEILQTSILDLKSSQSQVTRKKGSGHQTNPSPNIDYAEKQHENENRSDMIRYAITSAFSKPKERTVPKIDTKSKGVGFLLPYYLREERMLAKRAMDKSMIVKPVFKIGNDQKKVPKKQVKFSATSPHGQTKEKKNKIRALHEKKSKPLKTSETDLKDQSLEKVANQSTYSIDRIIPQAEAKQRNVNEITLLEKRMSEIEHIENRVRQRINKLKVTTSTSNVTLALPKVINYEEKTQLLNFDNLYTKAGTSVVDVKEVENNSPTVELPNNNMADLTSVKCITLHDKLLASGSSTVNTGQIELSIKPRTLKSIHHNRKLYGHYLRKTAHQKVGNFNPWTVADQMSDLILDDCMEEVAKELNKIPSSFVVDIYNQEFAQSLL